MADAAKGRPVFPDYRDEDHVLTPNLPLPVIRGSSYLGGWAFHPTGGAAFVLLQIAPESGQIHALLETVGDGTWETFASQVLTAIQDRLPGSWDEVEHLGKGREQPEWPIRRGAAVWLLEDWLKEDRTRFLIDGVGCPTLRDGFIGGFRFQSSGSEDAVGPERILDERPLEDRIGLVQRAFQIAAIGARERIVSSKKARQNVGSGRRGQTYRRQK